MVRKTFKVDCNFIQVLKRGHMKWRINQSENLNWIEEHKTYNIHYIHEFMGQTVPIRKQFGKVMWSQKWDVLMKNKKCPGYENERAIDITVSVSTQMCHF